MHHARIDSGFCRHPAFRKASTYRSPSSRSGSTAGRMISACDLMPLDSMVGKADPGSALGDGSLPVIYPASLGYELDQNSINQPYR